MKTKLFVSLLLLSAAAVPPSYANYFGNPYTGVNYNIGSAPNPTASDIRADRMATIAKADQSTKVNVADGSSDKIANTKTAANDTTTNRN